MKLELALVAAASVLCTVLAHGSHGSGTDEPRPEDWALWHLEEEHRM